MESSSSPVALIGAQRSNNTTPHHHYYSSPVEQPPSSTFLGGGYIGPGDPSQNQNHNGGVRRSSHPFKTPHNLQRHQLSSTPQRSRGQSPSVNSLGAESTILMNMVDIDSSSLSPHIIGHGLNHLHDDSHIHINCDSSHSISPPNSNSNTTISCGSGNSTSANIGVPTNNHHSSRDHHNSHHHPHHQLRNGRNINNNNRHKSKENSSCEDYENYRNNRKKPMKKSILEDDEKNGGGVEDFSENVHHNHHPSSNKFKQRPPFINPNQEFLPICDALFNMISLAAYFCDVVFDVLNVYSWYKIGVETEEDYELSLSIHLQSQRNRQGSSAEEYEETKRSQMPRELMWQWSLCGLVFILFSAILSQALSFKWYKSSERRGQKAPDGSDLEGPPPPCSSGILALMHFSLLGVLWRYFKLFIPVDLRFVKNEVRDLCLLRLIHAFCEAAPMLLLQLYLIWHEPSFEAVSDLTKVSTALSLFSVCWALASFSKNIRRQNVHKLVLTWLGVIFQFFWRLGTVTSRFLSLSVYAIAYQYWVVVVLFLHWFCMLLFLISPKNIFHGEKMSPLRKLSYSAIVAVVYTFCYINVQETNSRTKVVVYYVTMFLENSLLLGVYLIAVRYEDVIWFRTQVTWSVYLCFGGGLCFMGLYYKYFHVKKLSYVYDAESSIYRNTSSIGGCSLGDSGSVVATVSRGSGKNNGVIMGYRNGGTCTPSVILGNGNEGKKKTGGNGSCIPNQKFANKSNNNNGKRGNEEMKSDNIGGGGDNSATGRNGGRTGPLYNKINGHHIHHPNVPGVFNCRFHPAMKRKKKKPTSFVPPPAVPSTTATNSNTNNNTGAPSNNINVSSSAVGVASGLITTNEISSSQLQQSSSTPTSNQNQGETPMRINNKTGNLISPVVLPSQSLHHEHPDPSHLQNNLIHHHQHIDPSASYQHQHSHSDHYDNTSGVLGTVINSSMSTSAHYDLPEGSLACYDPNGRGGDGSASSSYGLFHPHMKARMMMSSTPFWRRPLSLTMGSENEGSVSSRVDIQQKLQEKKQQQLAELREIEEEIKQGKLKRPELHEIIPQPVNARQPIPIEKKQPWFGGNGMMVGDGGDGGLDLSGGRCHNFPPILIPSSGLPEDHHEILLDPQYLMYASPTTNVPPMMMGGGVNVNGGVGVDNDGSGFYYNPEWPAVNYYEPLYQNRMGDGDSGDDGGTSPHPPNERGGGVGCDGVSGGDGNGGRICDRRRRNHNNKSYFEPSSRESIYKSYRIPSDIDSQMSLPRSYTLPREFKYKRKFRKPVKTENFLPSTNSSDGDVDSGGEDPDLYSQVRPYPLPLPSMHHIHTSSPTSPPGGCGGGGGVGAISTATAVASVTLSPILPLTPPVQIQPTGGIVAGVSTSASSALNPAARQSRKVPNGRPRHKLHETKL
ncbi:unnamed protein product [Orchesella dallaii]|uniref:XK-related protein n=1 Tax=Orchesella dallaii TaxID=48710 RepID=A0ABP1PL42_9HEXA